MEKKFSRMLIGLLITLGLLLMSCGGQTETSVSSKTITATTPVAETTVAPKTTALGNWWDKLGVPKYGGVINLRLSRDPTTFDPYWSGADMSIWMETDGTVDWRTPPEVSKFNSNYVPLQARAGQLAESWEQPDLQTVILHIRKGVYWQNKPPVNGRELTASDIEYTFNRNFGLGDGYTKPDPYRPNASFSLLQSVITTDKYTVVFKWKQPSSDMLDAILDWDSGNCIVPREVIQQYGDMRDWNNAVGTGPWIVQDYVAGSHLTVSKNSNYWGYDERYPNNKLPYADTLQFYIIKDIAAAMSALQTGKIDLLEGLTWEQADSILRTNPNLGKAIRPTNGMSLSLRCDTAPFNNVKVRAALQMAVDLPTIAKTYYGGNADPTPRGLVGAALAGYYTPFSEWPKELQAEYTYNVEGAKKLLAEAGYPNGFDTNVITSADQDVEILKVLKTYFAKIGVNVEIKTMDATSFTNVIKDGKFDAMVAQAGTNSGGMNNPLNRILTRRYSGHQSNATFNNDKVYDAIVDKFNASTNQDERKQLMIQADMYAIEQHWSVDTFTINQVCLYSQKLKGFDGQILNHGRGLFYARFWKE